VKKTVAREYPSIVVNESILKGSYVKDDAYKAIDTAIHDDELISKAKEAVNAMRGSY